MENGNFERVYELQEKSIEALSKVYNRLEELDKRLEWTAQETKELNKNLNNRPCITQTIPYANLEIKVNQEWENRKKEYEDVKTSINDVKNNNSKMIEIMEERILQDKNIAFWMKTLAGVISLLGVIAGAIILILKALK